MNVLVRFNEQEATRLIERLATRREDAFQKLEAFRLELADLYGKDPLKGDVEMFLELKTEHQVKARGLDVWVKEAGATIPINTFQAVAVIDLPEVVQDVAARWKEAVEASEDPFQYWSDTGQKFKRRPVTAAEQAAIKESCKLYAYDEDRARIAEAIFTQVEIINMANERNAGVNLAKLREILPWLAPFVDTNPRITYRNRGQHFVVNAKDILATPEKVRHLDD